LNGSFFNSFFSIVGCTVRSVLDLSHNCFTLDTPAQVKIFRDGLMFLSDLEVLSVAYNKIMDTGCQVVCSVVKEFFPSLRILDLASCFLGKKCFSSLEYVLDHIMSDEEKQSAKLKENEFRRDSEDGACVAPVDIELASTSNPQLREILLQFNMFTPTQYHEYCGENYTTILVRSKCKLVINTSKYLGITFPLGYSLGDYGIEDYVLSNK
jgi:hypothetical protein